MKIKTALLSATLVLTVALATACSPAQGAEEKHRAPTAPKTAECLEENYWAYRSTDTTNRSTFALVMCLHNPVVQAELENLDVDQDNTKECQDREKRNAPASLPSKPLDTVYATMICAR